MEIFQSHFPTMLFVKVQQEFFFNHMIFLYPIHVITRCVIKGLHYTAILASTQDLIFIPYIRKNLQHPPMLTYSVGFGPSLYLYLYFVYVGSDLSEESWHMCRLV